MPSEKRIHIISFDNPFPPDYGGVIDVFYKLKSLHECGFKISLHAFHYGRNPRPELGSFCETIQYYPRKHWVNPMSGLPYIVESRRNSSLLSNLTMDESPILFEGLHSCYYLSHPALAKRKKLVRMHNIEHEYYEKLRIAEKNPFKRSYYSMEASRLKKFEPVISNASLILAISPNDFISLHEKYQNVQYIPAFHGNEKITSKTGKGQYAFYHGKLSVAENDEAACFLVEKVFSKTMQPLRIAGNAASNKLKSLVAKFPHISLHENIPSSQIDEMIENAHINVLPTFQSTGIKLKLINSLYRGRFVIANNAMVQNTGLENLCEIADYADRWIELTEETFLKEFSVSDIERRKTLLNHLFDIQANAKILAPLLA